MGMKLKCFVLLGFSFLIKMKNPVKTDFIQLCFENVTVKYFAFHETMQTVFHKSFFPQIHWLYLLTPNHILLLWWIWCYFLSWFFSVFHFLCLPPLPMRSFPVNYSFCRPRNGRRGKKRQKKTGFLWLYHQLLFYHLGCVVTPFFQSSTRLE